MPDSTLKPNDSLRIRHPAKAFIPSLDCSSQRAPHESEAILPDPPNRDHLYGASRQKGFVRHL